MSKKRMMLNFQEYLERIHKLRHTLRGGGGSRRSVALCDKGGRDPKFATSHLKNSIKAILHV